MLSLRETQQRAYRAIVLEENVLPLTRSRAARLDVYRNNARETFRKTLAATYPVVLRLVGDACFRGIAAHFMREFPSRAGDLGLFGAELATLLDIYYRDTEFAYLSDVARLEWACAEVETASGSAPFDLLELASVHEAQHAALRFAVRPCVRLVSSRYPVLGIWTANQRDDVSPVDLGAGGERVLVTRRGTALRLQALDAGTFAFAQCLADREPLADAFDAGCAAAKDFDPGAALTLLVQLDALAGFRTSSIGID
jgi:putative DNA-binding protein